MSVNIDFVKKIIEEKIPGSTVLIEDPKGDGYHLEAVVVSDSFKDVPEIVRHKMVYDSLENMVGNEIHALSLKTLTNSEKDTNGKGPNLGNRVDSKDLSTDILKKIHNIIQKNDVVLFMKGTKNKPLCGFSKNVVDILSFMEVDFIDINVLTDNDINKKSEKEEHYLLDLKDVNSNDIRQGIKDYSNWPTIPQLYIKTEFIGGFDIVKDMFVSKNLHAFLKEKNIKFKE